MPHRLPAPHAMIRLLPALLLTAALAGCATERVVTRLQVAPCPPNPPTVACPDMPSPGPTLRSLLSAWAEARAVHAACRAALDAWHDAHHACAGDVREP